MSRRSRLFGCLSEHLIKNHKLIMYDEYHISYHIIYNYSWFSVSCGRLSGDDAAIYYGHRLTFKHHKVMQTLQFGNVACVLWPPPLGSMGGALTKSKLLERLIPLEPFILHPFCLFLSLLYDLECESPQRYICYSYWYFNRLLLFLFSRIWAHKPCVSKFGISTSVLACITPCLWNQKDLDLRGFESNFRFFFQCLFWASGITPGSKSSRHFV